MYVTDNPQSLPQLYSRVFTIIFSTSALISSNNKIEMMMVSYSHRKMRIISGTTFRIGIGNNAKIRGISTMAWLQDIRFYLSKKTLLLKAVITRPRPFQVGMKIHV